MFQAGPLQGQEDGSAIKYGEGGVVRCVCVCLCLQSDLYGVQVINRIITASTEYC